VHGHHSLEDVALFPAVGRHDPSLDSVVDRLERDHLHISGFLDAISSIATALGTDDTDQLRADLATALHSLASHLLEHLRYKEESLGPLLQTMTFANLTR